MNLLNDYFSIKNALLYLYDKKYDININKNISIIIEKFDEDQLKNLSRQGLVLNKLIRLYYIDNVGFRCFNEQEHIYGKLPLCNNIEKTVNKNYLDSINSFYSNQT